MSHTIGNIIYGIPFTEELADLLEEIENINYNVPLTNEERELRDFYKTKNDDEIFPGFTDLDNWSGEFTGYLGILLLKIDERKNIKLNELLKEVYNHSVSNKIKEDIKKQISEFPEKARNLCPEPAIWIVWSSS